MGELRKDYLLDRWVLIVPARSKRPQQFESRPSNHSLSPHPLSHSEAQSYCFFCPGNEEATPHEIGRVEKDGRWVIRWIPNKFSAVEPTGQFDIKTDNNFYTFSSSFGHHEVVIESPDHGRQLADMSSKELELVIGVYKKRIEELMLKPHIRYVDVFKNSGEKGGTSILHTHTQVMALNHMPKLVRDELEAFKKHPSCPYCQVIEREKGSFRRCFENQEFVAFAPYASRFNYEIWIFPKAHVKNLSEVQDISGLADILHNVLSKIKSLTPSYNFFLHYSPVENFHFHIEVCPRISTWAGFEFSSDEVINTVSPEDAAAYYRGEQ